MPQAITAITNIAKPADSQPMELKTRFDIGLLPTRREPDRSLCHRRLVQGPLPVMVQRARDGSRCRDIDGVGDHRLASA